MIPILSGVVWIEVTDDRVRDIPVCDGLLTWHDEKGLLRVYAAYELTAYNTMEDW